MFYIKKPEDHVKEMKRLANSLQPFTPPHHPLDGDISWFKSRDIIVDGVPLIVNYSIFDHGDLKPIVLNIGCKDVPFLPFTVVCKVAKMYLGDKYLTLYECETNKIYSWSVLLRKGEPVEHNEDKTLYSFNGLDFHRASLEESIG